MGDKKGAVVPKKKTIRKPKFFPAFIGLLVLLMVVNIIPAVFILNNRRADVRDIEYRAHIFREHAIEDMAEMYCKAVYKEDKEICFNALRDLMYSKASEEKSHYALYFGNKKVLETTPGYFSGACVFRACRSAPLKNFGCPALWYDNPVTHMRTRAGTKHPAPRGCWSPVGVCRALSVVYATFCVSFSKFSKPLKICFIIESDICSLLS